jgi:hypothetical protein
MDLPVCLVAKYQEEKRQNQRGGKGEFYQNVHTRFDGYQTHSGKHQGHLIHGKL